MKPEILESFNGQTLGIRVRKQQKALRQRVSPKIPACRVWQTETGYKCVCAKIAVSKWATTHSTVAEKVVAREGGAYRDGRVCVLWLGSAPSPQAGGKCISGVVHRAKDTQRRWGTFDSAHCSASCSCNYRSAVRQGIRSPPQDKQRNSS